jgi:hypothetical protein
MSLSGPFVRVNEAVRSPVWSQTPSALGPPRRGTDRPAKHGKADASLDHVHAKPQPLDRVQGLRYQWKWWRNSWIWSFFSSRLSMWWERSLPRYGAEENQPPLTTMSVPVM